LSRVRRDTLYLHRENEGLGVRRLKEFNLSLFGKWVWRMMEERGSLWYNVLCGKYGEEGGTVMCWWSRGFLVVAKHWGVVY